MPGRGIAGAAARRAGGLLASSARTAITVVTAYLGLLTVAAWRARRTSPVAASAELEDQRVLVLIPAHDEERSIERTLTSLLALEHPPQLVEIHLVADNCTDGTVPIASELASAHPGRVFVHPRHDPEHPGKGPALEWLMARLADRPADAYVFVDADTTVDPGFVGHVAPALAAGHQVVQGHYAVRDVGSSPLVAFRAAALAARTFLRPLGRSAIGGSAGLYGNGMVLTPTVMATRRWSNHLVEDVELHLELLLAGHLVAFAPDAVVEAEMPDTLAAAESQNARWERGRIEMVRRYVPTLLRRAVTGGPARRVAYLDAALDQLVPPLSVVVAASGTWWLTALAKAATGRGRRPLRELAVVSAVGLVQVGYVGSALRLTSASASVYRSLLLAPRMVMWKLGLWLRALRRRDVAWERTARNG